MTATEQQLGREAPAAHRFQRPWFGRPHWMLIGAGILSIALAESIARVGGRALPLPATVRSLGTSYGSFTEEAPELVTRFGIALLATAVGSLFFQAVPRPIRRSTSFGALTAVTISTGVWFGWLATPHNAFPTNSRIHWVDFLTWDTDDYIYAAGRLPHFLFYDYPWLWQAINASLLVLVCYATARQLQIGRATATLLSVVVALSGNILTFADTSEDVLLNLLLIMVFLYATLRRNGWFSGLALVLLILGRPSFAIVALAVPAAELVVAARGRQRPTREQLTYVVVTAVSATIGVVVTQIYFTLAGRRYFLNEGEFIYFPELADLTQIEVDGFTLSAFSGAYVGHLLWVFPVVFLIGTVIAIVRATRQPDHIAATVYVAAISVVLMIGLLEGKPILYYNVRYLTYAFPFLVVATWSLLSPGVLRLGSLRNLGPPLAARSLLVCLIAVAPIASPADPIATKRSIENRPEIELLDVRSQLRDLAEGRTVYLDFGTLSSRNYLSYVLRRNRARVIVLGDDVPPAGSLVISRSSDPWSTETPLLRTPSFVVVETPDPPP